MTDTKFPAVMEGRIGDAIVQTVNARDLHTFLGVDSRYNDWIANRIREFDFSENIDFVTLTENLVGGGKRKNHFITLDMGKELGMVERTPKGKEVRQYFIDCEKRAKDPVSSLNDPASLRRLLLDNVEKVLELQMRVEEMQDDVDAYEHLTDATGTFSRTEAAKNLGVPPNILIRWMKTNGWTYRRPGAKEDLAYQSKIALGYLEHKITTGPRPDGTEWASTQVRITTKGLAVLAKAFPKAARAA